MKIVCTNCKETLANIEVLVPFSASVHCGECGATVGHQLMPDAAAAEPLTLDEQITQAEDDLADLSAKLRALKATPRPPVAASGS
jgi:hypothetical protein